MKRNGRHVAASFLLASLFAVTHTRVAAEDDALRDENLLQTLPVDFKIGDQQKKDHVFVQWASHSEPTKQEFQQRMRILASVRVCDARRKESPCSMPSRDTTGHE
jgi:hypothetical protein